MGTVLWSAGIWLVLLAAVGTHSAAGPGVCPQDCPKSSSVFSYQDGKRYTYSLEGTTVTTLPGTQGDVSTVHLKATVEVGVKSTCSHIVRIKNLQIIGPDDKKHSLKELEGSPIIANFQGGLINSQICTAPGESQAALNIKRAVISLLQSSAPPGAGSTQVREVDIFGICPTDISYSKSGETTTIKKSRNLNKCAHREDLKQEFLSTPFIGNADLQSIPLLESTQNVEQTVKKGVIHSVVSEESYLFRPFAKQSSGARTTVKTQLTLTGEKAQALSAPDTINVPLSIIFDDTHRASQKSNKQSIIAALQAAGESMPDVAGADSARKFQALVGVLRHSSKDDILSVYREVKAGAGFSNNEAARKVLLDALFRTGTGDSVGVAVELIRSNEISSDFSKLWYAGFAFVRHASLSSVTAVSTLLDEQNLPREALLGIGSLAGRYCREHNCENVQQVNELISKLSKRLSTKISSRDDENRVIAALKALHNIHHLNNAVADTLQKIASDHSVPTRVRVAALETYHSDACRPKLKKSALEILNDPNEDSEIRIKAYLVLVECPCGTVANNLKELLEKEPVNQVGGYIVSHLRNLRASANPSKADARTHLGLLRARKHYPENISKFSRNYELSYIMEALNIGSTVESDVIFSQSSYVPRSVFLNLTTSLFGHNYNVLELGTRVENADRLLESYLGPKGYLKTHNIQELLKDVKETLSKLAEKIKNRVQNIGRHKRSISKDDLDRIRNEVIKSLPPSPGSELIIDLSVKLFGSELLWLNSGDKVEDLSVDHIINKIFDAVDGSIEKAKKFDHHIKQHWTFIDTELTYPTGTGLPLRLVASGSTAVHLKLAGQIDVQALINDPQNAFLQLELVPSAAVEVTGELLVDAHVVESGLKVAYTLHTATGANIGVKILDGTGVDIVFGLPLKKQDILTLKTEVLKTVHESGHSEVDTPLTFTSSKKEFHGCFDQIKEITGLVVCGDFLIPFDSLRSTSAFYPLNGPSLLSLRVESTDVEAYHLRGYLNNKDPEHRTLELLFETPNSKVQRRLALLVEANSQPNKEIKISLSSPWKSVAVQGILIDTNTEQSITAKLTSDDILYSAKLGVKVSGEQSHQTYTPLLEYKYPQQKSGTKKGKSSQVYNVQGTVTVDRSGDSRKYTFNKVSLRSPYGQYEVDGSFTKDTNLYATDVKVTWDNKYIIIKNKLQKLGDNHYEAAVDVIPSVQKDLSIGLRWKYERKSDELRNELVIIHGQDLRNDQTRITLSQYLHYRIESVTNFDISTRNSLTYPILNIHAQVDGAATPKSVDYNLKATYDIYKLGSELHAKTGIKKPGDYDIKFIAEIQNNTLNIASSRDIIADGKSKFVNIFELAPATRYELVADVTHLCERNNINFQTNGILKISGKPDDYKTDLGLIVNPDLFDTHANILIGSDKILDAKSLIKRENNYPSGETKLYLKNYLDASSTYNFNNAGGKATLNIDIIKIQRKIQGNVVLTIEGTVYTGDANLQWHAGTDPSQQLTIHTVNDIRQDSIESKNAVTILDQKTVLNVKGALTGKLTDGHLIINSDLTLPNGHQLAIKLDRNLQIREVSEGRFEFVLLDTPSKGSPPMRLVLSGGATNVNPKVLSFEGDGNIEYFSPIGKNLKVNIKANSKLQDDHRKVGGELHVTGSLLPKSLEIVSNNDISKDVITYKASGALGSDFKGSTEGTILTGLGGKPVEIDNTLEVTLPNDRIKNIKINDKFSILVKKDAPCELKTNNVITWNGDNTLKLDGQVNADYNNGQGSAKVVATLPNEQPQSLALTWSLPASSGGNEIKRSGSATFHWGGDKEAKFTGEAVIGKGEGKPFRGKFTAVTPNEKLKRLDLTINSKIAENLLETHGVLDVNDKKITLDSKIGLRGSIPLIDVTINSPSGISKLYVNFETLTREQIKGQIIHSCPLIGGLALNANIDAHLSIDSPKLRADIDAPHLKIDKWHIEADQRNVKGAKKIIFSVKSQDKTIIAGSTTLRHKQDANSETYDGAGNIEIGDQGPKRFNFRLDRVHLTQDTHQESGIEYKLNIDAGDNSLRSALKSSNKEVSGSAKYCAKELCSNVEASTKLITGGLNEITHDAVFIVDLKNLEVPVGFSFREHTERRGWSLNHEVDIQLQHSTHRTAFNIRALASETGLIANVTLPQRVLSVEILTNVKFEKSIGEQEITFQLWWDKVNKPSLRTVASVGFSQKSDKNGLQVSGQARFNNPSLERELSVKGYFLTEGIIGKMIDLSIEIDVFKKANQKIILTTTIVSQKIGDGYNMTSNYEIKSKGQNIDIQANELILLTTSGLTCECNVNINIKPVKQAKEKHAALSLEITKEKIHFLFKLPTAEVLRIDGLIHIGSTLPADLNFEISGLGIQPLVIHTTAQKRGVIAITTTISRKGNPNKKLIISGGIENGVYLRGEVIKQSESKELAHITVSGNEKDFLKTDFSYSTENINDLGQETLKDLKEIGKKINDASINYGNEVTDDVMGILDTLKKSQPNVPRLLEVAQQELKAIRIELENDEVLKSVSQNIKNALGGLLKTLEDALQVFGTAINSFLNALLEFETALIDSLKKLSPVISDLWKSIINIGANLLENVLQETSKILNNVADLLKKYESEIKQLVNTVSELFHDINEVVSSTLRRIADEIIDLSKIIIDGVKDLPVANTVKETYAEFVDKVSKLEVPSGIWNMAEEIIDFVKGSVPNPEIQELITAIEVYVEKHVKKQPVDDQAELKKIYEKLIIAIKSLVNEVQKHLIAPEPGSGFISYKLPFSLATLYQLPRLLVVRLSPLSYLASDDLPRLIDLYYAYRPTLNPYLWIPPSPAIGVLIRSNNFITFDKRHYTFKGSCSYVLAQDYLDGNFSLVVTLENGKLKAITVSDNFDSVELRTDKTLKVNGASSEYPVHQGDISAWREYYFVSIKSKAGAYVQCHTNFDICVFIVSGFYHGRTRGLLGTIDNEQYDDFSLPNGKVALQAGEFANAWKLNSQCADVPVQTVPSDSSVKECADIFGGYTSLRACYPFANPSTLRDACNEGVSLATNKLEMACTYATVYVEMCQKVFNVPLILPASCQKQSSSQCNILGGEKISVGEHATVKSPQKAADIVIVVQQVLGNADIFKDLVTPLVTQLTNDLKRKGITDVNFALIGFGAPGQKWPAHLTSNGKIGFGNKNVKFLEKEPLNDVPLDKEHVIEWLKVKIERVSQYLHQAEAHIEAFNYPFRAGATKLILGVSADSCWDNLGFLSQIRKTLARRTLNRLGINFHYIMPIEDLHITGQDKVKVSSIVGIDSGAVYTLDKKKADGDSALRDALEYKGNICADIIQATNGVVYNSLNFLEAKGAEKKQFVNAVSSRITTALAGFEQTEDCFCYLHDGVHPKTVCYVTDRLPVATGRKSGVKG